VTIRLKVKKVPYKELTASIIKGMAVASQELIETMEAEILAGDGPAVWKSRPGGIQSMLEHTGLDKFTKEGALLDAWYRTLNAIKIDRRFNNIAINWFNSRLLNEGTLWVGLSDIPTAGDEQPPSIVYGGGYRPIGRGSGWEWGTNPYPGYGYWLLYEQGFDNYRPDPFIYRGYSKIFDGAGRFTSDAKMRYTKRTLKLYTKMMYKNINLKLRGA